MSPLYTYKCSYCETEGDDLFNIGEAPRITECPFCGHKRHRVYTAPQISVFKEYVTPHITGQPVCISSRSQEREILERHGLTRVTNDEMNSDMRRKPKLPSLAKMYQEEGKIECMK